MSGDRFFLDTVFIQALLNRADQYHRKAVAIAPRVHAASEVWTTESVLTQAGNALSSLHRLGVARFIDQTYSTQNLKIVSVNTPLFMRALDLYRRRADQEWGLTDCISFIVMNEQKLTDALTADKHFVQAGFRVLLAP